MTHAWIIIEHAIVYVERKGGPAIAVVVMVIAATTAIAGACSARGLSRPTPLSQAAATTAIAGACSASGACAAEAVVGIVFLTVHYYDPVFCSLRTAVTGRRSI